MWSLQFNLSSGRQASARPSARLVPLEFSPALLADPDADPELRAAEWRRVFGHFNPRLLSFFKPRVSSGDMLDTLVAEVWRRALLRIGGLQSPAAAWTWLTTIGTNLLRDQQRRVAAEARRWARAEAELTAEASLQVLGRVEEDFVDDERADLAQAILAQIPLSDRQFLELVALDDLTHQEIADRLGLPSAAASRQRLRRLRLQLRGFYDATAHVAPPDDRDGTSGNRGRS